MIKIPPRGDNCLPLSGAEPLMTSGAAGRTSSVAALRLSVGAFLAPKLYFIFLSAFDASLLHFTIVFDLCFRKFTIFSEDDVETQTENTKCDKD